MANIADVKARLKAGALARFGQKVYVNGLEIDAIFVDESFDDETGQHQERSITVDTEKAKHFRIGDSVFANGLEFEINKIPESGDLLITVLLKRA